MLLVMADGVRLFGGFLGAGNNVLIGDRLDPEIAAENPPGP